MTVRRFEEVREADVDAGASADVGASAGVGIPGLCSERTEENGGYIRTANNIR